MTNTEQVQSRTLPGMSADEYLTKRVDNQIEWYDMKSGRAQRKYLYFRLAEIVMAALIPIVLHFSEWDGARKVAAFFGAAIVAVNGILGLYKWHDLWKNYRTTCETLRHHRFLFTTQCAPYDGEDGFCLFVNNIERVISEENSDWKQIPFETPKGAER